MCSRPASNYQNKLCFVSKKVNIAYEVMITFKGSLSAIVYVFCYLENQFYVFQTAPIVVYILRSVIRSSKPGCH